MIGPWHGYTEGIDVHHGANWIIRYNMFRNIHVPATAQDKFRPAILMWSGSRDTIVHHNTFINCERGIIFGLGPKPPFAHDHSGGMIYNNFIYRDEPVNADAGISLWDSPGTRVYHNTVIQNGTYPDAIEYRFPSTTNVEIINNLTDGAIKQRDGAQALVMSNFTAATFDMFVNAPPGNLHLRPHATAAIDRGIAIPAVTTDFDDQPRPFGPAPDLGADERHDLNGPPVVSITVAAGTSAPLGAPIELRSVVTNRSVQLFWTDRSSAETAFVIERTGSRRDAFVEIARVDANATSFTAGDLRRGSYRYRVHAYSSATDQHSPYSNIVEVIVR